MNLAQKQTIRQLAEAEIRYAFAKIKAQTDADRKTIKAYYFFLVDDFFATANAAITVQDMQAYDPNDSLLEAIWSGECELYEGEFEPVDSTSTDWLDRQSQLYKTVYQLKDAFGDSISNDEWYNQYKALRAAFEEGLIEALQHCDKEGVFGNRAENGILLVAFYVDDYDGNGENSVLYRSARALNDDKGFQYIVK